MQAKDIDDRAALRYIDLVGEDMVAHWVSRFSVEMYQVFAIIPEKVVMAKFRKLIRRGLMEGCTCGCRGDFHLTDEGKKFLHEVH